MFYGRSGPQQVITSNGHTNPMERLPLGRATPWRRSGSVECLLSWQFPSAALVGGSHSSVTAGSRYMPEPLPRGDI